VTAMPVDREPVDVPRPADAEKDNALTRIGVVAERTGVSERTLRYYEQMGLLWPSAHTPGGSRRYCEADVARVERIRNLQSLMGFNLQEIGDVLAAEDRLATLRQQYHDGGPVPKQALLADGMAHLEQLRTQVDTKIGHLNQFRADLEAKIVRYRQLYEETVG
jgi:DNA-binding transcriptional MerR regulator